jgi:glycosyltransferase involved in cell wall biosynthesis
MSKISVIIPFLNEEEAIPALISTLNDFFAQISSFEIEIIFVDDGSIDRSSELLKTLSHNSYSAKLINLSKNFGSHAALRAGIAEATGDFIVNSNADLQDPLSLIPELFQKCELGAEIVWAHRKSTGTGLFETFFTSAYAWLVQKLINPKFPKMGLDVVMFSKKIKKELDQNVELNSSLFLQIMTMGFKQDQIFFNRNERSKGKSKWTISKKIKLMIDTFISFSYSPIRLVTIMGILFSMLGFAWTIYIILRTLFVGDLAPGWPAMISILLIGFGITNLSLGVIAEYLWRTFDASRNRKIYIIDKVTSL